MKWFKETKQQKTCHTGLARGPKLRNHYSLNSKIQICICKNDKGCVATQFHADLLHSAGRKPSEHLSDPGRSGEAQFLHLWMRRKLNCSFVIRRWNNMETRRWNACF